MWSTFSWKSNVCKCILGGGPLLCLSSGLNAALFIWLHTLSIYGEIEWMNSWSGRCVWVLTSRSCFGISQRLLHQRARMEINNCSYEEIEPFNWTCVRMCGSSSHLKSHSCAHAVFRGSDMFALLFLARNKQLAQATQDALSNNFDHCHSVLMNTYFRALHSKHDYTFDYSAVTKISFAGLLSVNNIIFPGKLLYLKQSSFWEKNLFICMIPL